MLQIITLNLMALHLLVAADDGERSLSAPPTLNVPSTSTSTAQPVKGSRLLFTSFKTSSSNSATKFVINSVIDVEKIMEGVSAQNSNAVKQKDPQLRKFISSVLDLESLGRGALATYWAELDKSASGKKQKERYLRLFKSLVEENYLEKIRLYVGGKYQIILTGEKSGPQKTIVFATIKKKEADVMVEFHLKKKGENWSIVDTKLDETSLEEAYRGSFNRIIKKNGGIEKGLPELLKVMDKRLAELKQGKATKL